MIARIRLVGIQEPLQGGPHRRVVHLPAVPVHHRDQLASDAPCPMFCPRSGCSPAPGSIRLFNQLPDTGATWQFERLPRPDPT